jgi:hypothetical protein
VNCEGTRIEKVSVVVVATEEISFPQSRLSQRYITALVSPIPFVLP